MGNTETLKLGLVSVTRHEPATTTETLELGLVSVTRHEPATTHEFYFISKEHLSTLDIVKVKSPVQEERTNTKYIYGYVQEVRHLADSESHMDNYVSNNFLNDSGTGTNIHNKLNFYCIKVRVIYDESDTYTPVKNQEKVMTCTQKEISKALYINNKSDNNKSEGIEVGKIEMYKGIKGINLSIKIDPEYLIGPQGSAHLNISGISGLACKTSYVRYLISKMQTYYKNKIKNAPAYILFNVKGDDLMGLNTLKCNKSEVCNCFNNVTEILDTDLSFSFKDCKDHLDLVFGLVEDTSGNLSTAYSYLQGPEDEIVWGPETQDNSDNQNNSNKTTVCDKIKTADDKYVHSSVKNKFLRIYKSIVENSKIYVEGTEENIETEENIIKKITFKKNNIYVYDISNLNEHEQNFVVGYIIRYLWDKLIKDDKNQKKGKKPKEAKKYVIFMDEMNKFAPIGYSTPIVESLVDISERGRQFGMTLFGAEQFRSKVNDRILGNCAANAYGRTNSSELYSKDYGHLSMDDKNALTTMEKGSLLFTHAFLRCPVKIKFDEFKRTEQTSNSD